MNVIKGVGVVNGLNIIPGQQHSNTIEYTVPSRGCVYDGAWDINEGLE
jgi:hypothetical protein